MAAACKRDDVVAGCWPARVPSRFDPGVGGKALRMGVGCRQKSRLPEGEVRMDILIRSIAFTMVLMVAAWGGPFVAAAAAVGDDTPASTYATIRDDDLAPVDARLGDDDDDSGDASDSADRSRDITTSDKSRSADRSRDVTTRDRSHSRDVSWDATGDTPGKPDVSNSVDFSRDRTGDHNTADVSASRDFSGDRTGDHNTADVSNSIDVSGDGTSGGGDSGDDSSDD
jgi:hypothetical protein